MHLAVATTSGLWLGCPPDVLARCFLSQLDHTDNCAAACTCKSWHDAFRVCTTKLSFFSNPLNKGRFPASYMRQFPNLSKVTLVKSADWQAYSRMWLSPTDRQYSWSQDEKVWAAETLASLPASCCQLTLDHFLPQSYNRSICCENLRSLYVRGVHGALFYLNTVSHLHHLEVLRLEGSPETPLTFTGSLTALPASLKWLDIRGKYSAGALELAKVIEGQQIEHLSISLAAVAFGTVNPEDLAQADDVLPALAKEDIQIWRQATSLTSLELMGTPVVSGTLMAEALRNMLRLQKLVLRHVDLIDDQSILPLVNLLQIATLQTLDITNSPQIQIFQQDFANRDAHVQSFAFHYNQLSAGVELTTLQALMQPAQQAVHATAKPALKVEGQFPHFGYQHWVNTLPLTCLTHLTIVDAHKWPVALFLDGKGNALPSLEFLDVSFASLVSSDMDGIMFSADSNLKELYISGTTCTSVDLSACSSLVSLGIIHRGHEAPATDLPSSLQKLYLHNVLRQDSDQVLVTLSNLTHLQLGGRAAVKGALKALPELHERLVHLDLWDGCVTALQKLSNLTNLKKLTMPVPPSPEQLIAIKQLRQLRHIEVTTHQGMHTPRGKVVPPWSRSILERQALMTS